MISQTSDFSASVAVVGAAAVGEEADFFVAMMVGTAIRVALTAAAVVVVVVVVKVFLVLTNVAPLLPTTPCFTTARSVVRLLLLDANRQHISPFFVWK